MSLGSTRCLEFVIRNARKEELYTERVSEYALSLRLNTKLCMYRVKLQEAGQKLITREKRITWELQYEQLLELIGKVII